MSNQSPPRVRARNEPWTWPESQQLEVNPNHWAADSVVLAVPVNRPFVEDVSPYQSGVTVTVKGSYDLTTGIRPFLDGNAVSFRGGSAGDYVYLDAPHTDNLGASGTEFAMMARCRCPTTAASWRAPFVKGDGAGSVVWFGPYGANTGTWINQFDDGAAANAFQWNAAEVSTEGNWFSTEDWAFVAMGQNHGVHRFAKYKSLFTSDSSTFNINNPHNWVIGGGQFRNDSWLGDVKDMLVLDKYTNQDEIEDLDRNMADVYRPKIRRSFFFYEAAAVAAGIRRSQLMTLGVS